MYAQYMVRYGRLFDGIEIDRNPTIEGKSLATKENFKTTQVFLTGRKSSLEQFYFARQIGQYTQVLGS